MHRMGIAAIVVALLVVTASPVAAAKPTVDFDEDYDETYLLIDCSVVDTGFDFVVMNREIGHHRQLLWATWPCRNERSSRPGAPTTFTVLTGAAASSAADST